MKNELFLHNERICQSKILKMHFFGPNFFRAPRKILPDRKLFEIHWKTLWFRTIPTFLKVRQNQYVKSDRAHCYAFLVPKLRTWNWEKMEISPTSRISWWHSLCVLLSSKIEPWVLQHTHSESLRTMSACWIWNEALRGALREHGQKWPATHFRPQFCDSDLNEILHAARAGHVHSQLCYSLFWSDPHRASCGAEKSKLREKCDVFNNITYAIVQFGQFYGW